MSMYINVVPYDANLVMKFEAEKKLRHSLKRVLFKSFMSEVRRFQI